MKDTIIEQLIEQGKTTKALLIKLGLLALTVLTVFLLPLHYMMVWAVIAVLVMDVIIFRRLRVEFEYIYFNGDLDIDKIMNRSSRKRVFTTNIKEVEVIAPSGSDELRPFQQLKVLDYSTQEPEHRKYEMVTKFKGDTVKVIFEPNEKILEGMKYLAPRKVKI